MGLTMGERQAVVSVTAGRYRRARKKEKIQLLNEFIEITGYTRSYARLVLRNHGKRIQVSETKVVVGDVGKRSRCKRPKVYDGKFVGVLRAIWVIMDYICGKRLAAILPELVEKLEQHREIRCDRETREKLLKVSAATIDRVLKAERRKYELRGRSRTKPGTLLKHQIPIRTFTEWDDKKPGFVEVDLVAHDGGNAFGDFIQTLDLTDVHTGWTETFAVQNKAQVWVFEALKKLRKRLPFPLLGLDSDNGGEFINHPLLRYCKDEEITFTRARPYRKNDNCFVEQKNWSVVRRAVGYARYDSAEQLLLLNQLYDCLRLFTNYFQPTMKLKSKERIGSKVKKHYEKIPQTPYQRVLGSAEVSRKTREQLKEEYSRLNPAALKRTISSLQQKLLASLTLKKVSKRSASPQSRDARADSRQF